MKKQFLIFFFLTPFFSFSQNYFAEICPDENTNGTVVDFELYNNSIYATGFFTQICGEPTNYVARFDTLEWVPVPIPLTDPGHSLKEIDGKLFIAKYEESIDSNWLYTWDGNNLEKFGAGVYLTTASGFSELPNIYDVVKYNDVIIACGEFDKVGSENINNIMQWDGNKWQPLGDGLTGTIPNSPPVKFPHQLLVHNDELYVCGNFRNAGGEEVNGIAKWDGVEWSPVGAGFNNTVYTMGVYNNELFVGGTFTQSGANALKRMAKWNGSEWVSPGFGFVPANSNDFSFVHTILPSNSRLLIAGGLKKIEYDNGDTEDCGGIVSWNSGGIDNFGGGVPNNDIEAIFVEATLDGLLIGGGVFGSGYLGVENIIGNDKEVDESDIIRVYPNPVSENIFIDTKERITKVQISDVNGKIILFSSKIMDNQINLAAFNPGVYFMTFTIGDKIVSKRILKF
ncbi:MAG: T9SS type A sorting domain-containing protein [Bacteroidota bacterium]